MKNICYLLGIIFIIISVSNPTVVRAACDPSVKDWSTCSQVSLFGTHIAGNLLQGEKASVAEQNFAAIRDLAHNSNPATKTQRIPVTALFDVGTIQNQAALRDILKTANRYGIDITMSFDSMPVEQARETGAKLSSMLAETNMTSRTRVYIINEANWTGTSGTTYGQALSQFVAGCGGGCNSFLTTLGGPPGTDKATFVQDFARYVVAVDPKLLSKIKGIAFNTYGQTPDKAISDWTNDLGIWRKELSKISQSDFERLRYFLTEVGPPDGDPAVAQNSDFLIQAAKYFAAQRDFANGNMLKVDGLTWFIWRGSGETMVLFYVDDKTGKIESREVVVGSNLGTGVGTVPIAQSYTLGNRNYQEQSQESCSAMEGQLEANNPAEYRDRAGEKLPGLRTDAGLNHGTSVRGAYCGQQRGDSLVLREIVPFSLSSVEQCKRVAWTGSLTITADTKDRFRIPFASELADQWAGTLDAEHLPEKEVLDIMNNTQRSPERSQRTGLMRYLLPAQKQDELKCSFVNYVRRKGGTSMYSGFRVDGKLVTELPCPPTVASKGALSQAIMKAWDQWNRDYGKAWGLIGLIPNERSTGDIKFQVCDDLTYVLTQEYPEVMRLGLASNELFKRLTPYEKQKAFFDQYKDFSGSPLDQSLSVVPKSPTSIGLIIAKSFTFLKNTIGKTIAAVSGSTTKAGRSLAHGNPDCGAELGAEVQIIPGPGFNYAVRVYKTACGEQKHPNTIGDVQISLAGGTPHTENMWRNELKWDTLDPNTVSFLPRFRSQAELQAFLGGCNLKFRADIIHQGPTCIGAVVPGVPAGPPYDRCQETKDCSPKTAAAGQLGPSDVSVWSQASKNVNIGSGGRTVEYVFKVPAWKPNDPMPNGCSVNVVAVDKDEKTKRLVKRACTDDNQCLDIGACKKAAGFCGTISCLREHDRVVDVYNNVPFLGSLWEQAAGFVVGKYEGFLNRFTVGLQGGGDNVSPPFTGCSGNPDVVFDINGRFVPRPAASEVTYRFNQKTGAPEVVVRMVRPQSEDQRMKILFYRLGGVCNANDWVSGRLFQPRQLQE